MLREPRFPGVAARTVSVTDEIRAARRRRRPTHISPEMSAHPQGNRHSTGS